jgi:hypothetical protein
MPKNYRLQYPHGPPGRSPDPGRTPRPEPGAEARARPEPCSAPGPSRAGPWDAGPAHGRRRNGGRGGVVSPGRRRRGGARRRCPRGRRGSRPGTPPARGRGTPGSGHAGRRGRRRRRRRRSWGTASSRRRLPPAAHRPGRPTPARLPPSPPPAQPLTRPFFRRPGPCVGEGAKARRASGPTAARPVLVCRLRRTSRVRSTRDVVRVCACARVRVCGRGARVRTWCACARCAPRVACRPPNACCARPFAQEKSRHRTRASPPPPAAAARTHSFHQF